ncbi:MAG: ABC transporter substrate-binding protein [Chloroflexota bacterium]|nr:ABC transporter substrate-binding protein [Chloroflexota bacterium]
MRTSTRPAAAVLLTVLVATILAACTGAATVTPSPTPAVTPVPASVPPTPNPCAKDSLTTTTAGKLTVGADNPAFPPYFDPEPADPNWELGNPSNGKGFESAVAYAVAEQLGFANGDVTWIPVPFDNAVAPGSKEFDIYLTQVSYSAERAQAVDLSDGYFDQNQTVIALASNPIAKVTTVAALKAFKLGAPAGTTSYDYIVANIQPTADASAYNSLSDAIAGLNAKQIDGVVVDLPTAFYATAAQMENGKIVGTLPTIGEVEHFSIVLDKGSPLTDCVNQALAQLSTDGTLLAITDEWITGQGAPELK